MHISFLTYTHTLNIISWKYWLKFVLVWRFCCSVVSGQTGIGFLTPTLPHPHPAPPPGEFQTHSLCVHTGALQ